MKIRKIVMLIFTVFLTVSLSGCSFSLGFFMNKIVRPPKLGGEQEKLQLAFEKSVGADVLLKSPARGKYLSSFVTYDIDGDGSEEVFVFYANQTSEASVRLNVLDKVGDEWISISDLKGSGSAVYEIEFVDVNLDGKTEIIISWSLFDNKTTRIISIIDFDIGSGDRLVFTARANEYFSYKELIDFDLDGYYELCVFYIDNTTEVPQAYLRAYKFTESNSISLVSELLLDSNITAVSSTKKDIVATGSGDCTRLFLDVMRSDSGLFTEVVMWSKDNNKLVRLLSNPSADTYRSVSLNCRDINGDGNYEIPVVTALAGSRKKQLISGSEETKDALYIDLIKWMKVDGYTLSFASYSVYNPNTYGLFGFEWKPDAVTAKHDDVSGGTIFSLWDAKSKQYGDDLFSIYYSNDISELLSGYTLIQSNDSGNYWCKIYPAGENIGITVKYISEKLQVIQN